jgi:competence protein ComGC
MNLFILGIIGPFQLIFLLVLFLIVAGFIALIVLIVKNAKNKSRANTLDDVIRHQNMQSNAPQNDRLEKLERLNQLRNSGALTEEEFEAEKKKILG